MSNIIKPETKHSIRRQFALIFIGLMAGTILLCILVNNIFLSKYYIQSKTQVIYSSYEKILEAANSDSYGTSEFTMELDNICRTYNITVYIMDAQSQMRYVSVNGGKELESRLIKYIFGMAPLDSNVIESKDDYVLRRTVQDGNEYIEMYGRLSSGISFIMRTPIESIRESAALANRFFIYVGIISTLAGGIIIWIVSRKITKPIMELNEISQKMVDLDFDARYEGKASNEIGLLGSNINKLSKSLEKAISELKTANNELMKDIERKEKNDEMRKEFLSNVSHELKTPIALIQGYAEGLKEGISDDPESMEYYCDVIIDESAKMNSMVKKLLTLNQLEFGNDIVNLERFNIVELVENYVQSASILTKQNNIKVNIHHNGPIYVWGDEFKVEEVIMNYFSNAVNHCEGEKYIDINIEEVSSCVRVSVFNTGKPIPEDSIAHIWEKFYKVDKARTREYGGSGVGLSIVKAIMDSLNQKYGVKNFDNGVMFWFELETVKDITE